MDDEEWWIVVWWRFDSMSVLHPGDEFEVRARRDLLQPGWKVGSITTWVEVGIEPRELRCDLWPRSVGEPRRFVAKPVPRRVSVPGEPEPSGTLRKYGYPEGVVQRAQSVVADFETGAVAHGEVQLARLTLSLLAELEERRIEREQADQVFALIFLYLTDDDREREADANALSDAATDLVLEGNLLGHYGDELGPDPAYLRSVAGRILARTKEPELDAAPSVLAQSHKEPGGSSGGSAP